MIFCPSGDQLGLKQRTDAGSDLGPPQPGTGISLSPVPSEWTAQTVFQSVAGARAEKRISFPCGDQLPHPAKRTANWSLASGVICRSSVPSTFAVKRARVVAV